MFTLTALTRRLGQSWTRAEALATRLVPVVLRRILTVGIGAGALVGGLVTAHAEIAHIGFAGGLFAMIGGLICMPWLAPKLTSKTHD